LSHPAGCERSVRSRSAVGRLIDDVIQTVRRQPGNRVVVVNRGEVIGVAQPSSAGRGICSLPPSIPPRVVVSAAPRACGEVIGVAGQNAALRRVVRLRLAGESGVRVMSVETEARQQTPAWRAAIDRGVGRQTGVGDRRVARLLTEQYVGASVKMTVCAGRKTGPRHSPDGTAGQRTIRMQGRRRERRPDGRTPRFM
jgi:hypothetical protein